MSYLIGAAIIVALVGGFLTGMVTLRRSDGWCPQCGEPVRCVKCAGQPSLREARRALQRRRYP